MKFFSLAAVLLLVGCQNKKDNHKIVQQYPIEQFYKNINVTGGNFSSDASKLLLTTNESGVYNIHALPINGDSGVALTHSSVESFYGQSYFPNDDRFIYSHDNGGDENYSLFVKDIDGKVINITPWDSTQNLFFGWSKDEKSMFISSNKRDKQFFDLYELPIQEIENGVTDEHLVFKNTANLEPVLVSPNKTYIALIETISNTENKILIYNIAKDSLFELHNHNGEAQFRPQFFSLDDKELYYTSNKNAEFNFLEKINLQSGKTTEVYKTNWDVWYAFQSHHGKYHVVGINENASTQIKIFNTKTGNEIEIPDFKGASVVSIHISKNEKLASLKVGSSVSPNDFYLYNFESKALTRLTHSLNPEIDPDDLVEGKVVHYKSFDGLEIPAIYYQPKQATKDNKVPALVWVHGGPGGQSRLNFFEYQQHLINHGYAILAVNNRGSSGYGKTFHHLDDKNHGGKDLKDCIAAKDFLASTGVVDTNKIGITGGSYGGYMTMAALCFTPEEFAVGVNVFGVTNWVRTLRSIPPYWEAYKQHLYNELGDPYSSDSTRLYDISPLFHADKITKPVLVLQGAKDVRVLQIESDELVEAVRKNGVPVEYIVLEDEGHGIKKKKNQIESFSQIKVFLDKYLKNEAKNPEE